MSTVLETDYSTRASNEYFHLIVDSYSKVTAIDPKYLKKIRRRSREKQIREFIDISDEEKEELVDLFTDLASIDADLDDYEDLKKKIEKVSKFGKKFERLRMFFDYQLQPHQQAKVINDLVIKINSNLAVIYKILRDDVIHAKEEDIEKIMIAKQVIYVCLKLGYQIENRMESHIKVDKNTIRDLTLIFILILKLEAARRGKIDFGSLHEDLTLANYYTENELVEEYIGTIYEVIGMPA